MKRRSQAWLWYFSSLLILDGASFFVSSEGWGHALIHQLVRAKKELSSRWSLRRASYRPVEYQHDASLESDILDQHTVSAMHRSLFTPHVVEGRVRAIRFEDSHPLMIGDALGYQIIKRIVDRVRGPGHYAQAETVFLDESDFPWLYSRFQDGDKDPPGGFVDPLSPDVYVEVANNDPYYLVTAMGLHEKLHWSFDANVGLYNIAKGDNTLRIAIEKTGLVVARNIWDEPENRFSEGQLLNEVGNYFYETALVHTLVVPTGTSEYRHALKTLALSQAEADQLRTLFEEERDQHRLAVRKKFRDDDHIVPIEITADGEGVSQDSFFLLFRAANVHFDSDFRKPNLARTVSYQLADDLQRLIPLIDDRPIEELWLQAKLHNVTAMQQLEQELVDKLGLQFYNDLLHKPNSVLSRLELLGHIQSVLYGESYPDN